LTGDTANEGRAMTYDGQYVVGLIDEILPEDLPCGTEIFADPGAAAAVGR
jgi:hypothetical protein